MVMAKILLDRDGSGRRVSILIEQIDSSSHHILLRPIIFGIAEVRVVLAEIIVDPDLRLAMVINADHVLLHNEKPNFIVDYREAFECRHEDIEVVGVGYILDFTEFEGDSLCVERARINC